MTSTASITAVNADGQPVDVAHLVGYLTMAEAAERTGRKPWAVHQHAEAGQLTTVTFNGRPYVSATEVDALT